MNRLLIGCTLFAYLFSSKASAVQQGATFQLLPGTANAWAVSADGSTVIGAATNFDNYRWKRSTGLQLLGTNVTLRDVSGDGDIVVGLDGPYHLGLRLSATSGRLPAPNGVIEVLGTSTDGNVLVGSVVKNSNREAYRWTEDTGLTPIGDLPGSYVFSIAQAVSSDGTTVVGLGYSDLGQEPFRWTQSDGMRSLGDISGSPFQGAALNISDDGRVIVGGVSLASDHSEAFAWTEASGRVDLGDIPGGRVASGATGVSQHGDVIVGLGEDDIGPAAIIWDRIHGMRRLEDVLRDDYGINTGIRLYEARDVSADGRTIVGSALVSSGVYQGFVVTLPELVPEPESSTLACVAFALLELVGLNRTRLGSNRRT